MPAYGTNNKWIDRNHPQTLYLAALLLYINAAFWLLQMLVYHFWILGALAVAAVFGGIGLANEKKEGFWLAVAVAALNLFVIIYYFGGAASISFVINVLFAIALIALLLHPMTRNYRRIWFKSLSHR